MGKRGPKAKPVEPRFWSKVDRADIDGCWLWVGPARGSGYGVIKIDGKMASAHRFAYELANGPIPNGMCLDHICQTKICVNPSHLRLATVTENGYNRGQNANNTSGFKGVSWDASRQKWRATIQAHGKSIIIGRFTTPELANQSYQNAAALMHGEFANQTT